METIYCVTDQRFARYGRVLHGIPVQQLVKEAGRIEKNFSGVKYERALEALEKTEDFRKIQKWYGGGMRLQCGLCWGHNKKMNAVEYHRSTETNIGAEDMILR